MNNCNLTYFTDANTCCGYNSFLPSFSKKCRKTVFLQNAPVLFKKNLCGNIIKFCGDRNLACHRIMQPGYASELCGIYIPGTDALIFCVPFFENAPEGFSATEVCSSLSSEDNEKINLSSAEHMRLKENMYSHLAAAKHIHDDWEKIYISNMDFTKADKAADDFISETFKNFSTGKSAVNSDRFFGSMLPSGSVNYIDSITDGLEKRIFVKGRPGTGKSTFLKKIRNAALARGLDTETYYCSFDPHSLDMVVIRDISLCIFDSTSPHEMFPSKDTDGIFDIYEIAVTAGTDEKFSHELEEIKLRYDIEMAKAKEYLADILDIIRNADSVFEKYIRYDADIFFKQIISAIQ